jgi:hypothetical protein
MHPRLEPLIIIVTQYISISFSGKLHTTTGMILELGPPPSGLVALNWHGNATLVLSSSHSLSKISITRMVSIVVLPIYQNFCLFGSNKSTKRHHQGRQPMLPPTDLMTLCRFARPGPHVAISTIACRPTHVGTNILLTSRRFLRRSICLLNRTVASELCGK